VLCDTAGQATNVRLLVFLPDFSKAESRDGVRINANLHAGTPTNPFCECGLLHSFDKHSDGVALAVHATEEWNPL